jgi:hypothetical protein
MTAGISITIHLPGVAASAADVPVTRDVVVRVHISVGGGEEILSGDLISTAHIPAEPDKPVDVPVRET